MPEPATFKSGKDLGEETRTTDDDSIACVDCGVTTSQESAYEHGWRFGPPVCPDCLRWYAVGDACCVGPPS